MRRFHMECNDTIIDAIERLPEGKEFYTQYVEKQRLFSSPAPNSLLYAATGRTDLGILGMAAEAGLLVWKGQAFSTHWGAILLPHLPTVLQGPIILMATLVLYSLLHGILEQLRQYRTRGEPLSVRALAISTLQRLFFFSFYVLLFQPYYPLLAIPLTIHVAYDWRHMQLSAPAILWRDSATGRQDNAGTNHDLTYFLTGSFLANIGLGIQAVAQGWLILKWTHSPYYLGIDAFIMTIGFLLFSMLGGITADRAHRGHLIVVQLIRLIPSLLLGGLMLSHTLRVWHILAMSFWTGAGQAIGFPLYQRVMSTLVEEEDKGRAVGINIIQSNLGRALGALTGGWVFVHLTASANFLLNALGYGFFIGLLCLVQTPLPVKEKRLSRRLSSASVKQAIHHTRIMSQERREAMRENKSLFLLFVLIAASSLLLSPLITLLPDFVHRVLRQGPQTLATLNGFFGIGSVLGVVIWTWWLRPLSKNRFSVPLLFAQAGALAACASGHLWIMPLSLLIAAATASWLVSVTQRLIQSWVVHDLQGRTFGLMYLYNFTGLLAGNLGAGWVAKTIGTQSTYLIQAALLALVALYVWIFYRDDINDPQIRGQLRSGMAERSA